MANSVDLEFKVSAQLLSELTQNGSGPNGNGVNAYLWYNGYGDSGAATPWTNVVLNGVAQTTANGGIGKSNTITGTTDWKLTLTSDASNKATQVSGGKVYLLIQSNPTATPTLYDLPTLIGTTEGNIRPSKAFDWNFSYDTFEVALANNSADVADLSSINSFGHQLGISVTYADNTVQASGYNSTYPASGATSIDSLINSAAAAVPGAGSTPAVINFPTGSTLASQGMIAITPATDNGQQAPTTPHPPATPNYTTIWQPTNWQDYVTAVGALSDIQLVGHFNGAPDGSSKTPVDVWHNAGYYAYSVTMQTLAAGAYGAAGSYFVLSPEASSQIKGYIVISPTSVETNLYSPGLGSAPAYVFSDATLLAPYNIDGVQSGAGIGEMNTGANNQWGNVLTQFFTGFTAGYYSGIGESIPTAEGSPHAPATTVNLDQNYNWDPTYAFDGARTNTIAASQHYDPYAKIFFDNSNVYGTAYGDALTTNFTKSVTVPAYDTSGNIDVGTIDLWAFGATETMTTVPGTGGKDQPASTNFYAPYTIDNYLVPGAPDYAVPTAPSAGTDVTLNLGNNGLLVDPDAANIQLGIYLGGGNFQYLTLPSGAARNGGGPWQTWQITQDLGKPVGQQFAIASIPIPGNFSAVPPTSYSPFTSGTEGSLQFDNLPAVAGKTNWYQLVVGSKTFNFYATLDGSSNVTALAADGLADVTPPPGNALAFTIPLVPGSMDSLPASVMKAYSSSTLIAGAAPPTSPVAGTLAAGTFTPVQTSTGQAVDVAASVFFASGQSLAFGWTGTNTATGTTSWISGANNKIAASNVAHIEAVDLATGATVYSWNVTPDIDGQWTTPTSYAFATGAYAVRMTEMLADGTTPYGQASSPVYVVISASAAIVDTAAHISGALDAYQAVITASPAAITSIKVSDNLPITVDYAGMTADTAALAVTVNANSSAYKLNVVDTSATLVTNRANLAALNNNATVVGIGFTDPGIPALTLTDLEFTSTYSTAIGEMMGERTLTVSDVAGQAYTSFEQDYRHGVLTTGASGSGVLALTRQFATSPGAGGPVTAALAWEHDIDSMNHAVRDYYSSAVNTNGVTVTNAALPPMYQTGGAAPRSSFTTVEYDYANGVTTPSSSTFTYYDPGPGGKTGEEDRFNAAGHQTMAKLVGFNPSASNNYVAATETEYATINGTQTTTATKTYYEYSTPVAGNQYTLADETLDSSGRILKHTFSGLYGAVSDYFSSYEEDFLGGVFSGGKGVLAPIEGAPYTGGEIDVDANKNVSRVLATGITSQPYSSYENDYSYANGAYANGNLVGQKYYYTNVEGQSYTSYEVDLDATGAITSITYDGYKVSNIQPYATLEYFYSGGTRTGAYNAYITNIAGKTWTGEEHDFNTSGQLVRQVFTGVTDQTSTSYEFDYANGDGVLTGQKFYYTNVPNQGYSSYESDFVVTGSQATQALAIYNMNGGGHTIQGMLSTPQTIDSIYNDITTGGTGADTFAYTPFFGQATITDFTSGTDKIQLPTLEFANYAYLQSNNQLVGGNLMLTGSNGDTLTLQGVNALPGQSNFLFS